MTTYHPRRPEKTITDKAEFLEIIRGQKYMTLSMCKDNDPYLATVNYAYDEGESCFYFHCSPLGKKVDFLNANPLIWGLVLENRGYILGDCNHAYRTIQFQGRVEFLTVPEEKRRALHLMMTQLESDPEPWKKRALSEGDIEKAAVGRVRVLTMSGKKNPVET